MHLLLHFISYTLFHYFHPQIIDRIWSLFTSIERCKLFSIKQFTRKENIHKFELSPFSCKPSNPLKITVDVYKSRSREKHVYFIQLPNLLRARQFDTIKKFSLRTDHKSATDA